jgi:hypothetical protein
MEQEYFFQNGKLFEIEYVTTYQVEGGIGAWCSEYCFLYESKRDLAFIYVEPYGCTPRQLVNPDLHNNSITIEGFLSGDGYLKIERSNRDIDIYEFNSRSISPLEFIVYPGDIMQWFASTQAPLSIYEICTNPPYEEGRFIIM